MTLSKRKNFRIKLGIVLVAPFFGLALYFFSEKYEFFQKHVLPVIFLVFVVTALVSLFFDVKRHLRERKSSSEG